MRNITDHNISFCVGSFTLKFVSYLQLMNNKKVLLREHKGHTARRVASARYCGGRVPHPVMVGGTPGTPPPTIQTWLGYPLPPPSRPGPGGYPRYPPPHHPDLAGVTPPPPHHPDLAGLPPPPPSRCWLTNKLKTVPSPILRMRAVKILFCRMNIELA